MDGDPVYLRLVVQVKFVFAWRLDFKAVSGTSNLEILDLIGKDKHPVGRTRTKAFPIDVKAGAESDRGSASLIRDRQVFWAKAVSRFCFVLGSEEAIGGSGDQSMSDPENDESCRD